MKRATFIIGILLGLALIAGAYRGCLLDEAAPDLAEANGPGTVKALRSEAEWLEKRMVQLCSELHGGR